MAGSEHTFRSFVFLVAVAVVGTVVAGMITGYLHIGPDVKQPNVDATSVAPTTASPPATTAPTSSSTTPATEPPTSVTEPPTQPTEPPTEPTQPPTEPTDPPTTVDRMLTYFLDTMPKLPSSYGFEGKGPATVEKVDYKHAVWSRVSSCAGDLHHVDFDLSGRFQTLEGVVGLRSDSQPEAVVSVQILFDGQEVLNVDLQKGQAVPVPADVTGVADLRIQAKQIAGSTDCSISTGNNRLVVAGAALTGPSSRVGGVATTQA